MTTGLIILGIAYGIITVLTIGVNFAAWADENEYVTVSHGRWDGDRYIEPVKARNMDKKFHARLIVLAPFWPVMVLVVVGQLIGEIMIDAFRRED